MASRHRLANWNRPQPRSAGVAAAVTADPEPAPKPPGQKDTRSWCRGKPGREHQPVVVFRPYTTGGCDPAEGWQLEIWPDREWSCQHREECGSCGRVLRDRGKLADAECPDWPGTAETARLAAAARAQYAAMLAALPVKRRLVAKPVIDGPQGYRRKRVSAMGDGDGA